MLEKNVHQTKNIPMYCKFAINYVVSQSFSLCIKYNIMVTHGLKQILINEKETSNEKL